MEHLVDLVHEIHGLDRPGDRLIALLAGRQHGVVGRWQLYELGFGRGAIEHRLAMGRLHRVHTGVYAAGHPAITGLGLWMAAVLSCGPGAVLSHRSAAAVWSIRPSSRRTADVTVPGRSRARRPGVAVHLPRRLHPDDLTVQDGIPVTSVARTLLDLSELLSAGDLDRAIEQAERLRLFDLRALDELCRRSPGRRGLASLTRALELYRPAAPGWTRSHVEREFLRLCNDAGLPPPSVNMWVEGFEVDALWHVERLVVELDTRTFHATRAAFERDRHRDATLQVAGFRTVRVTGWRLEQEPEWVVRTLRALLGLSSAHARPA